MRKIILTILLLTLVLVAAFFLTPEPEDIFKKDYYCAICDPTVIDKQKFYEDDLVIAMLNFKPVEPGSSMVLPKRRVPKFEDLSDEEILRIGQVLKKVNQATSRVFGNPSYLIMQKNGVEVGQTQPQVHFHYIPRQKGDSSRLKFLWKMLTASLKDPMTQSEMDEVRHQLAAEMDLPTKQTNAK